MLLSFLRLWQGRLLTKEYSGLPASRKQLYGHKIILYHLNKKSQISKAFAEAFPFSADSTIFQVGQNRTYVITGDIPAMWLRDSYNQVEPYINYAYEDPDVKRMLYNLVNFQSKLVMAQPYANAYLNVSNRKHSDNTTRLFLEQPIQVKQPWVWQRKYQIDSIGFYLKLINKVYSSYKQKALFDNHMIKALRAIAALIQEQLVDKKRQNQGKSIFYRFKRPNNPIQLDHEGAGMPGQYCGLVRSGFRPSDDRVLHPYNIPGNALLSKQLQVMRQGLLEDLLSEKTEITEIVTEIAQKFQFYYKLINAALKRVISAKTDFGNLIPQQVDCKGEFTLGDDPNLPSIMALVSQGFLNSSDPLWINTKKFLYSPLNQLFYSSSKTNISGLGSTHTPKNYIWPLGIMTRLRSASTRQQVQYCIDILLKQGPLMHQSFDVQDPKKITRQEFAWANSMFGGTILQLAQGAFKDIVLKQRNPRETHDVS